MAMQKRLALGAIALLCALFAVRSVQRASEVPPLYNWDMTCYVALAIAWGESDPEVIHRRTYETLQAEVPEEYYRAIITGGVKQSRYEDPAAFHEHLAFYRARILYTYPIYLLNRFFDVPLTSATWGISRAAWFGLACLMAIWAAGSLGWFWGLPVGTLLAHAPWFVSHLGFSSPDLQATLLTCLGLYFLIERRKDIVGAALLTATIAIRPDTVILALVLAAALWFFDRESRPSNRFLLIWSVGSVIAYVAVSKYAGAYGWWPLFWISFIKKEVFPSEIPGTPNWTFYLKVVQQKLTEIPHSGYYTLQRGVTGSTLPLAFVGLLMAGYEVVRRSGNAAFGRYSALFVAFGLTYGVRWILFPQLWDRFFAVLYACVPLVFLSIAAELSARREKMSGAPVEMP